MGKGKGDERAEDAEDAEYVMDSFIRIKIYDAVKEKKGFD